MSKMIKKDPMDYFFVRNAGNFYIFVAGICFGLLLGLACLGGS